MSTSGVALILSLTMFAVILMASLAIILNLREEKKYLRQKLFLEEQRTQKMLNMMLARDLPQLAGLNQVQVPNLKSESSEQYIPRDDVSEFHRLQSMGANPGYGETVFDFDAGDPELNQTIREMMGNGQISYD